MIWWIDATGTRRTARRPDVKVWAYVSAASLLTSLDEVLEGTAPKIIARALRHWRTTGDRAAVLRDLRGELRAVRRWRRRRAWLRRLCAGPNHNYSFNRKGPHADDYVGPGRIGASEFEVDRMAAIVTAISDCYGGPDVARGGMGPVVIIEGKLSLMAETLDEIESDIAFFIDVVRQSSDIPSLVTDFLPVEWRRECEHCSEWFALTRQDIRFCSNACRQAAYRARQSA